MTMLGHVHRRQVDDDPSLETDSPHVKDFYKAVMIQSQRMHLEQVEHYVIQVAWVLLTNHLCAGPKILTSQGILCWTRRYSPSTSSRLRKASLQS